MNEKFVCKLFKMTLYMSMTNYISGIYPLIKNARPFLFIFNEMSENKENVQQKEDEDSEPYMLLPDVSSDEMHLVIEGSKNEEQKINQIKDTEIDRPNDPNIVPSSQCCLLI